MTHRRTPRLLTLLLALVLLSLPVFAQPVQEKPDESTQPQDLEKEKINAQAEMDMVRAIRENVSLFGEIYRQVNMRYVDQVNPEEFMKAGIQGMLSTLDPYTDYIERENSDDLRILSEGEYGGVGLQIGTRGPERVLTVISPIEGTPAWRLGLRAGDQILFIDGETTEGFSTSDAAQKLRGKAGSKVKVKVNRYGIDDLLEYTITRERIEVKDVSFAGMIEPGIGYVRLTRFSRSAGEEVSDAIEDLLASGEELDGMILDLRSNPGGLLPEAKAVAENFLEPGEAIVSTRGRMPRTNQSFTAEFEPTLPADIPLVILINGGSASASEIVSGAVQDLDRGVIIGNTSFGKGLVQNVINFADGTALRITTAKYYTPSGRLIQKADYFNDNEALMHTMDEDPDSVFHTSRGREVIAHGGIVPDIVVENREVGELTLALWRQDIFFDFISKYMDQNPETAVWDDMGPVLFDAFRAHMDSTDFDFDTQLELEISDLRKTMTTVSDSTLFLPTIQELEAMAKVEHEALFERERDELENRLVVELAASLEGQAGRTRASVMVDDDIAKAVEVLTTEGMYDSALAGSLASADPEDLPGDQP